MRGVGAILGYLLGGLGVAGCATTSSYRREEDPCPGTLECSCAEGTGWIPGLPFYQNDRYMQIGTRRIDSDKELYSVKYSSHFFGTNLSLTMAPKTNFQFKLDSEEPQNPSQFNKQTQFLTETILKSLMGNYSCEQGPYSKVTIHIVGHADRLGDDQYNKKLSEKRARRVGEGIMLWLLQHSSELIQPVHIEYLGLGEEEAASKSEPDESSNEKQRRVDVSISSYESPIGGDWQMLTVVQPGEHSAPSSKPSSKNPFWD